MLGRYTRLASCDIWGTKEVDFLGLDDFSSPYQDEEVIGRTPTLAQLNSEDSQPVCEALYPPADLTLPSPQPQPQPSQLPCHSKRPGQGSGNSSARPSPSSTSSSRPSRSLLPDFPEGSQKATRPVPSSTETMAKTQNLLSLTQDYGQAQTKFQGQGTKMAAPASQGSDFVRKAKVRVSAVHRTQPDKPSRTDFDRADPPVTLSQPQDEKASTSASATLVGLPVTAASGSGSLTSFERRAEGTGRREMPVGWSAAVPHLVEASQALEGSTSVLVSGGDGVAGASGGVLVVEGTEKSKEEEHNYSLFLTRRRLASRAHSQLEEDEEDEDDEEEAEAEEEEEEGDRLELDDEDHDEGFGSEHELSENEEEEDEEEDEDYEADKDDDMSDAFSEPGSILSPSSLWLTHVTNHLQPLTHCLNTTYNSLPLFPPNFLFSVSLFL